jgi:hypothetical protein
MGVNNTRAAQNPYTEFTEKVRPNGKDKPLTAGKLTWFDEIHKF